jgi:hypothetical protein
MFARLASCGANQMPAQKRELRKNYIGIVSDKTEEQRAVKSLANSDRLLKNYLRGLLAAVLNRDDEAR